MEIPLFTLNELVAACKRLKSKRSPGPDRLPSEVVKLAVGVKPDVILRVMNHALVNEDFPKRWKVANLVLLKKEGNPDNVPSSFRSLCLLDSIGKLLEHLLHSRLVEEIERTGELAEKQYGFRAGRSTVDAVQDVMRLVDRATVGTHSTRRIPAVVTLDIRNAFNSASWEIILGVPGKTWDQPTPSAYDPAVPAGQENKSNI